MSFGPENAQGEFELTGDARDQHIADLTGLAPDTRSKIPQEEIRQLIIGTRNGDRESQERLIATRLRWIYSHAFSDEIRSRADLDLQDVMQYGILATLEAAEKVDATRDNAALHLQVIVPRTMDAWMTEGKLVPSVDADGHIARRPARDRSVLRDQITLVAQAELDTMIERTAEGREDDVAAPEATILRGGIDWLFDYAFVPRKQREVLRLRYGDRETPIAGTTDLLPPKRNEVKPETTLSLREIARQLGTSTQNVSILEHNGLATIRLALGSSPEVTGAEPTAEQLALRQQWFAEIAAKQDRGEIAFVQGSLLKRPLPRPLRRYLEKSREVIPNRRYSEMLRRAFYACGIVPDRY